MAKVTQDDRRGMLALHEAVREAAQCARLAVLLIQKLQPSMIALETLSVVERRLVRIDALLAEAGG